MSIGKVARRLRSSRERAGISLRELARRTGISPTHLSRIESGEGAASEKLLRLICKEIEIEFDELALAVGKIPRDILRYIAKNPAVLKRLRREMDAA